MMRIVRERPVVINLNRRYSLLALNWLARSPYAAFQTQLDELERQYREKLLNLQLQYEEKIRNLMNASYNERLQAMRQYLSEWNKLVQEIQMLRLQLEQAKQQGATSVNEKMVERVRALEETAKKYQDKIAKGDFSSVIDEVAKEQASKAEAVSKAPSTPSAPSHVSSGGGSSRRTSSYSYREVPTNTPGVTAVVDSSGRVVGYHDSRVGMSYAAEYRPQIERQYGLSSPTSYFTQSSNPITRSLTEYASRQSSTPRSTSKPTGGGGAGARSTSTGGGDFVSQVVNTASSVINTAVSTVANTVGSLFSWLWG